MPSALQLLTTVTAEGPDRRRAIAAWSAAGAAAGASGFVIGGIVTDLASWRFVFWAYLPLAAGLLDRFPRLALADTAGDAGDLHWRGSLLVRSLSTLPITLG